MVPGSRWVTIRLEVDADIHLLLTLVSLALQSHQRWTAPGDTAPADCNEHRGAALPRTILSGS